MSIIYCVVSYNYDNLIEHRTQLLHLKARYRYTKKDYLFRIPFIIDITANTSLRSVARENTENDSQTVFYAKTAMNSFKFFRRKKDAEKYIEQLENQKIALAEQILFEQHKEIIDNDFMSSIIP